jgi:hypothetical protein
MPAELQHRKNLAMDRPVLAPSFAFVVILVMVAYRR